MTDTKGLTVKTERALVSHWCGLALVVLGLLFAAGCATTVGQPGKPADVSQETKPAKLKPAQRIAQLEAREMELQGEIRSLKAKLRAETNARESLERRLEVAQAAREDAIREVVRIRERIQGMASEAEATAMFAEARVLLDRMEAEAFSGEALEQLDLAKSYMAQGKGALDKGNPGGAAYLFDLVPGLYESMKNTDPRVVEIKVKVAVLRESPSSSSRRIESLYLGASATGLEKNQDWIKVKASSGKIGWIMKTQVQ